MRSHTLAPRRLALWSATALIAAALPVFGAARPRVDGQEGAPARVAETTPGEGTPLRVGAISIEVFDVFDLASRSESNSLAAAANLLHPATRPSVVRRELLFRTGDRFEPEALRQTERNLRALGLFRRVEVTALPAQGGAVPIVVRVHDAWSLATGASFRHEGGFSAYDVRVREGNLAGLGVGVSARYGVGFERREVEWSLADQRLFGSRERLAVLLASRSDGSVTEFSIAKPFFTLASPAGHIVAWRDARERYRTYEDGNVRHEYNLQTADATIGWTWRLGRARNGAAWRLGGGYRYVEREYSLLPGAGPGEVLGMPGSYRWGGPFVGIQFLRHRYEKRDDVIAPGRDVDFNLGLDASADLFISSPTTGPHSQQRVVAGVSVERGWRLPGRGLMLATARAGSESGGAVPNRGNVTATLRLWAPHSESHVTAVLCEGRMLLNPDRGVLLYLGGTPGLRGFNENQFAGTRSLLLITEERKYLAWRPAGLVQPGVAAFAELGVVAAGSPPTSRSIRADAGVGLRLVNLKASGLSVIKVDVAVPIGEPWRGWRSAKLVVGFRREL